MDKYSYVTNIKITRTQFSTEQSFLIITICKSKYSKMFFLVIIFFAKYLLVSSFLHPLFQSMQNQIYILTTSPRY